MLVGNFLCSFIYILFIIILWALALKIVIGFSGLCGLVKKMGASFSLAPGANDLVAVPPFPEVALRHICLLISNCCELNRTEFYIFFVLIDTPPSYTWLQHPAHSWFGCAGRSGLICTRIVPVSPFPY
jgi:hypothetical protein